MLRLLWGAIIYYLGDLFMRGRVKKKERGVHVPGAGQAGGADLRGAEWPQTTVTSVTPAATRTRLTLAMGELGATPPTCRTIFLKSHSNSVLLSVTTA